MRTKHLATLFFTTVVVTAAGCQQTPGTIPGGAAPPGPLAPVNPNQPPILGPFGGNTRVTPPATGSYQPTGGYLGTSSAPVSQPGYAPTQSQSAVEPVVGSGVQVAGFTETNSHVAQQNLPTNNLPAAAGNASDPRSGGMHVNDLTGAPAPPGYRPSYPQPNRANYVVAPQSVPNPIPATPSNVTIATPSWQQSNPLPQPNAPMVSQVPANVVPHGPSTEPVTSSDADPNLMWRRPGGQF